MRTLISAFAFFVCSAVLAQESDPVVMTVNGEPVLRSEFEYSYNKNNTDDVIDKKTVQEYVDLFINYKLKVLAALDAKLDTMASYQSEFATYRDQQVRPSFVTDEAMLAEAKKIYDSTKASIGPDGLIMPAHILMLLKQDATKEEQAVAKQRVDSIYQALKNGSDFEELAKKYSQDPGSAANGGKLPWLGKGQLLKEFEDAAFALQKGEMSAPVLSPVGYHIILMTDRKQLEPFDTLKGDIFRFMEARGLQESIANAAIDSIAKASQLTTADVLAQRAEELSAKDAEMKNLIREYHDGLLLYEISNRSVWEKAANDEAGLEAYFKANRKKYNWDQPRYKGMVYHTKDIADVKAVKNCVKKLAFDQWADQLRKTFNNDSILRIRVEKGIFKEGDNTFIDKMVFKKNVETKEVAGYPNDAVYGKLLKKGPQDYTDVRTQVVADYQEALEKQWVAELRKRYPVVVNQEVLKTVNNHQQ